MTETARLVIAVDSTQVGNAGADLSALERQAAKTEIGIMELAKAASKAYGALKLGSVITDAVTLSARYDQLGIVMSRVGQNTGRSTVELAALELQAPAFALDVPANWDLVFTGLIIGVTAKPIHDLIGLLAETKNFMNSAAIRQREAAGAALADGVLKLAQSEAENMIDVPGMGLTRLTDDAVGGEASAASEEKSPTERYIDLLHNRTLM